MYSSNSHKQHPSPSHFCVLGAPPATYLKALEELPQFTLLCSSCLISTAPTWLCCLPSLREGFRSHRPPSRQCPADREHSGRLKTSLRASSWSRRAYPADPPSLVCSGPVHGEQAGPTRGASVIGLWWASPLQRLVRGERVWSAFRERPGPNLTQSPRQPAILAH